MQQIKAWIDELGYKDYKLEKIKADASLREYYRLIIVCMLMRKVLL